jgi:hypothetical protein
MPSKASILLLLHLVLVGQSSTVIAGFESGNELSKELEPSAETYARGFALGYVVGVTDTLVNLKYICLPKGVAAGQVKDVVKKYLDENPLELHRGAELLVFKALSPTWGCPDSGNAKSESQPSTTGKPRPKTRVPDKDISPF